MYFFLGFCALGVAVYAGCIIGLCSEGSRWESYAGTDQGCPSRGRYYIVTEVDPPATREKLA